MSDTVLNGATATWPSAGTLGSGAPRDVPPARATSASATQPSSPREHLGASILAECFQNFPLQTGSAASEMTLKEYTCELPFQIIKNQRIHANPSDRSFPQTPKWHGAQQGTARDWPCAGKGWQTQLWLRTLRTTWKGEQRDSRRWQWTYVPIHQKQTWKVTHIINGWRLKTSDTITSKTKTNKKPCIMNINLLCSVYVNVNSKVHL